MLNKTSSIFYKSLISVSSRTKIVFDSQLEFFVSLTDVDQFWYSLHIEDCKGEYDYVNIETSSGKWLGKNADNNFMLHKSDVNQLFTFYAVYKDAFKNVIYEKYCMPFKVSCDEMKFLNFNECNVRYFSLPKFEHVLFKVCVKKLRNGTINIVIENPYKIQIQGMKADWRYMINYYADFAIDVNFAYDPEFMKKLNDDFKITLDEKYEKNLAQFLGTSSSNAESVQIDSMELKEKQKPEDRDVAKLGSKIDPESVMEKLGSIGIFDTKQGSSELPKLVDCDEINCEKEPISDINMEPKTTPKIAAVENASSGMPGYMPPKTASSDIPKFLQELTMKKESHEASKDCHKKAIPSIMEILINDAAKTKNLNSPEKATAKTPKAPLSEIILPKIETSHSQSLPNYVILVSSDNYQIAFPRKILIQNSYIFSTLLKQKNVTKINCNEFNADTLIAAWEYLDDRVSAIAGKEIQVFKFASKYSLRNLMKACSSRFDAILCPKNVCEIMQIAYDNYFEELKQKCQKIITENGIEFEILEEF